MRVLIVKTSSLGDIVHTLPALTDARRALPFVHFDWVAEEAFAEIPGWHPAVANVIPVAVRRWRKSPWKTLYSGEWRRFKQRLREQHYDLVIDAQGLLKSALIARRAHTPIVGLDKNSAREPLARWCYRRKVAVPWNLHAVERVRSLFAQALEYPLPTAIGDYGIDKNLFIDIVPRERYVLFLHGTTRADKHWPEGYWQQLCSQVNAAGFRVLLPWGSAIEHARAQRIAASATHAEVLPRQNLHSLAGVIATSSAVVAVDTGLGHLSAALDVPTVSLYGPTDPARIGTYGRHQVHISVRDLSAVAAATEPRIMAPLTPNLVWGALQPLLHAQLHTQSHTP
jgi:heptosyltransferase-1